MAESDSKQLRHVAMIMDGNGRWAKQRGLPRIEGHRQGVENVRKIIDKASKMNLEHLTLYAFSVENWNRPKAEVAALMTILKSFLKKETKTLVENGIKLNILGRMEELPKDVQKALNKSIEATKEFTNYTLNIALNYGSRTEIVDATKAYAKAVLAGDENPDLLDYEILAKYLYTHNVPDPDLIIRTSGEFRVSNFLLLQAAYAEFYYTDTFWPDFNPDKFEDAVHQFSKRERRYGKTSEQITAESS